MMMKKYLIIILSLLSACAGAQTYLGETSILGSTGDFTERTAFPFIAPITGTLDSVCVHYNTTGLSARTFYMGIYDDTPTHTPGALLGSTVSLTTTVANRWHCALLISETPLINSGDTIWLATVFSAAGFVARLTTNGTVNINSRSSTQTITSAMPDPFGTSTGSAGTISMYAHYKETPMQAKNKLNNVLYFNTYYSALINNTDPIEEQGDSIEVLFSQNFDEFPLGTLSYDTIINRIQVWKTNYKEGHQSIVTETDRGKVLRSIVHTGDYSAENGFELFIPVDSTYDDLWVDYLFRVDPNFDTDETPGYHSGKLPLGFFGGREFEYYSDSTRASAWWVHKVFGSNEGHMIYAYNQDASKQTGASLGQIPTTWTKISARCRTSTPGKADGSIEYYHNNVFVAGKYDMKMRSVAQGINYAKIEGLKISYFFGGSGAEYASQRDNWIEVDDIVISTANEGTRKYLGNAVTGQTISNLVIGANKNVNPILYNETFTSSSGSMQSHYKIETPPNSKKTYTKTISVSGASSIDIAFDYYRPDWDYGDNSWTKVYSGTGETKIWLYTFSRLNLPSGTIHIADDEATIEYYIGTNYGVSKGWRLSYTSN